jgi:pSer/pThr/pTyr-binding forkhead associated (FHA) protein
MGDESTTRLVEACGVTHPLEFEIEDTRTGEMVRRVVAQPFLVIGRGTNVDLSLDDDAVSRRHAYLQVISGRIFCLDLQSRTGTQWDREGHSPAGWLDPARTIGIGPFQIRALSKVAEPGSGTGNAWDPLRADSAEQDDGPTVTVIGSNEAGQPLAWRMNRVLALIGHARMCKVRLVDRGASRICASLLRTARGLWLIDLFGRPGVTVNGRQVRKARLRDGDDLRFSKFSVKISIEYSRVPVLTAPALVLEPSVAGSHATRTLAPIAPQPADGGVTEEIPRARRMVPVPLLTGSETVLDQIVPAPPLSAVSPMAPGAREALAALVEPVAQQFALMQQQIFEEFTQRMLMMGRIFGQLHQDQLGAIREELLRLQEVAGELRELQAGLARGAAGTPAGASAATPDVKAAPRRVKDSSVGSRSSGIGALANLPQGTTGEGGTAPPGEGRPASAARKAPKAPGSPPPVPAAADKDLHAHISQRIHDLQREHESRWEKILSFLGGKAAP